MSNKAQVQAVSYVLVLGIILATVSATYFWGLPLLQKGEATSKLESARNTAIEIADTLNDVATTGSQKTLTFNLYGMVKIDPNDNSIYYIIRSQKSPYALNVWIPLGSDEPHGVKGTEWENSTAVLGQDPPATVLVRAERYGSEYVILYRIAFRELYDLDSGESYYYNLTAGGNTQVTAGRATLTLTKGEPTRSGSNSLGGKRINVPIYAGVNSG